MADNKMSIFNAKKVEFTKINSAMTLAKCYVLALGKNANYSHFSEENVTRAFSSLNYVPVVGHIITDDNDVVYLGGHDYEIVVKNGFKLKSLCIPLGVVLPSDNPEYEEIVEENGTKANYLVKNIILWSNRYPELIDTFYDSEVFCNQSMEINYTKYETLKEDAKYTDIIDFEFDALCMLGKSDDEKFNVTPCFPNAKIVPNEFSLDEGFKDVFEKFKSDLLIELKNTNLDKFSMKGDEKMEKELETLNNENNQVPENFSMKYGEKSKILRNLIKSHLDIKQDENGNSYGIVYAYLNDFDDECVYFELETVEDTETYNYTYKKYKQLYSIKDEEAAILIDDKIELFLMWLTQEEKEKIESEKTAFSEFKDTHKYENSEVEELINFKNDVDNKVKHEKQEEIFNEFNEELSDKNEYQKLISEKDNYSLDELKKECYFIRGLYANSIDTKESKVKKFSIEDKPSTDFYENVISRYKK